MIQGSRFFYAHQPQYEAADDRPSAMSSQAWHVVASVMHRGSTPTLQQTYEKRTSEITKKSMHVTVHINLKTTKTKAQEQPKAKKTSKYCP